MPILIYFESVHNKVYILGSGNRICSKKLEKLIAAATF
jgi:hypothetical protein